MRVRQERQLQRGLSHRAYDWRLRRVMAEVLAGRRPVKVGYIGGSITVGSGCTSLATAWPSLVSKFLGDAFPHANLTTRNGALGATDSSYMALCLDNHVGGNWEG